MADKRVWFITGSGRGMGVDIAQAALAAGHAVVATGRDTETVADAVGDADGLLVAELDITSLASAEAAVRAAVDRFGRIDVLVNNAGNFYAGFFEELTPEQIDWSLTTNLVGPMNVTRAVLPVMREQRSGNVVAITSTAGIVGQEFCSAYASLAQPAHPPPGRSWDAPVFGQSIKEEVVERFSFASEVAFVPRGDLLDRVTVAPLTPPISEGSPIQAAIFHFAPGSRLARHPATLPHILAVLDGSGEVSGADGVNEPIAAGGAVFWHEGEEHELKSAAGLTALIIEGEHVDRFRERPKATP